jgi:hypothetical protein
MNTQALADPLVQEQSKTHSINEAKALEEDAKAAPAQEQDPAKPAITPQDAPEKLAEKQPMPQPGTPAQIGSSAPGFVPKNAALTPEKLAAMAAQQTQTQTESVSSSPSSPAAPAPEVIATKDDILPAQTTPPEALPEEPLAPIVAPAESERFSTPEAKITKQTYRAEADFTGAGIETAAGGAALGINDKARLAELESLVQKLKAENVALNHELKSTVDASEEERLSIASDNWNLEQATMRFNEAERQIKRLGQELQQERAKCEAEKKDLEASLFDPQITGQEQLAKLAKLEQELTQVKQDMDAQRLRYEEQIRILSAQKRP